MKKDITAIGEILIDLTQTGINGQGVPIFAANPGGAPANVAVAAARLGASSMFLGKVGRDGFGAYLRRVLEENGVDTAGLKTGERATTMAVVSVAPDGEREFRFVRGADRDLSPDEVEENTLAETKVLHVGSVSLTPGLARCATIFAARQAHRSGTLVSYDPNYRTSLWKNREEAIQWMSIPLPLVDIIKLSEEELPMLAGTADLEEGSRRLEERGISMILVTLGAKGSFCRWQGQTCFVPGVPTQVADTNGAGDTFLGAVLSRLCGRGERPLEGLTLEELREILTYANRAAALTCSRSGAIPAMPTAEELEEKSVKGFTYTVTDAMGLHARPAGLLVKLAKGLTCTVTVDKGGRSAQATKLIALMSLGVKQGDVITVTVEGNGAGEALGVLKEFFRTNL